MGTWERPGKSDEWYTPAFVFAAMGVRFDLDVAAPVQGPRHVPADRWYSDASLTRHWQGFIWMNPPFGGRNHLAAWVDKFVRHGNGVALVPDRTSAPWFQELASNADALLLVAGKIKFEKPDGTVGKSPANGTVLAATGWRGKAALKQASAQGLGAYCNMEVL